LRDTFGKREEEGEERTKCALKEASQRGRDIWSCSRLLKEGSQVSTKQSDVASSRKKQKKKGTTKKKYVKKRVRKSREKCFMQREKLMNKDQNQK